MSLLRVTSPPAFLVALLTLFNQPSADFLQNWASHVCYWHNKMQRMADFQSLKLSRSCIPRPNCKPFADVWQAFLLARCSECGFGRVECLFKRDVSARNALRVESGNFEVPQLSSVSWHASKEQICCVSAGRGSESHGRKHPRNKV